MVLILHFENRLNLSMAARRPIRLHGLTCAAHAPYVPPFGGKQVVIWVDLEWGSAVMLQMEETGGCRTGKTRRQASEGGEGKFWSRSTSVPYESWKESGIKKTVQALQPKALSCAPAVSQGWGFRGLDSGPLQRSCHNKLHIFCLDKSNSWERLRISPFLAQRSWAIEHQFISSPLKCPSVHICVWEWKREHLTPVLLSHNFMWLSTYLNQISLSLILSEQDNFFSN